MIRVVAAFDVREKKKQRKSIERFHTGRLCSESIRSAAQCRSHHLRHPKRDIRPHKITASWEESQWTRISPEPGYADPVARPDGPQTEAGSAPGASFAAGPRQACVVGGTFAAPSLARRELVRSTPPGRRCYRGHRIGRAPEAPHGKLISVTPASVCQLRRSPTLPTARGAFCLSRV